MGKDISHFFTFASSSCPEVVERETSVSFLIFPLLLKGVHRNLWKERNLRVEREREREREREKKKKKKNVKNLY